VLNIRYDRNFSYSSKHPCSLTFFVLYNEVGYILIKMNKATPLGSWFYRYSTRRFGHYHYIDQVFPRLPSLMTSTHNWHVSLTCRAVSYLCFFNFPAVCTQLMRSRTPQTHTSTFVSHNFKRKNRHDTECEYGKDPSRFYASS
jgi:hypothetical protein